ncbi:Uncharacterised protein [Serratia entomophila]|nr:Uncharacterised protein [Serratia entomophila]
MATWQWQDVKLESGVDTQTNTHRNMSHGAWQKDAQFNNYGAFGESWDRSPLSGYRVSYVAFEQGKPVGKPKPVVTGFVSDDEKELYGAPVGLAIDKSGALLVADDVGNTVWRISAK